MATWSRSFAGRPNAILDECREIGHSIDLLERSNEEICAVQQRVLNDADSSSSSEANVQLQTMSSDIMTLCRQLTERVRALKSNPESRDNKNRAHVDYIDRRLKNALQHYQQHKADFCKRTREQMARQYRLVRPDATEAEVRAAVDDTAGGQQIFTQALLHSDRQGHARMALSEVQDRHEAVVRMERQMEELAQLFQHMDTLIVQQDEYVTEIDSNAADMKNNMDKANVELGAAVVKARKARTKKWICLGICGMLLKN